MRVPPDPSTWPLTLDAAVERLLGRMSDSDKELIRSTAKDQLNQFHLGWAMGIRNEFGLWYNESLLASCGDVHPDDASMVIVAAVWQRLHDAEPGPSADPDKI